MRKIILLSSCLVLLPLYHATAGTIVFWDPTGTTNVGGNAIWNTNPQWSTNSTQSATANLVALTSTNVACFSAGPTSTGSQGSLTVTINRTNSCAGIDNGNDGPGSCFLTVTAGSTGLLKIAGTVNTAGATQGSTTLGVPLTGNGSIVFAGPWTCTLTATNNYTGLTAINSGTLALSATGSIDGTPQITIAAGATYDVSAIANYNLSTNTTLKATGSAAQAKIVGGTTVNFGSQPILFTYDGTHPSLVIAQGTLSLNGNAFTVNKATALAPGMYTIISQTTGNITAAGTFSVAGTAIAAGNSGSISVVNGSVILTISASASTTTTLSAMTDSIYGQPVTLTATVAPTPTGGTVQFFDNSVALGGPVAVNVGNGTASYTTNTLAVGAHPITATYSGTTGYLTSSTSGASNQQVDLPPNSVAVTITNFVRLNTGALQMNFSGVAGYTYLVQAATNLAPPVNWTNLSTNTADINGLFYFTDTNAAGYTTHYYQTAVQQ